MGPMGFNLSDLGNAGAFARDHAADVRYCHPWKKWIVWADTHWRIDDTGEIYRKARETIKAMWRRVVDVPDHQRAAFVEHLLGSESKPRLEGMLKLAESEPGIAILPDQFDADPMLFNCKNCTLDCRKMTARPSKREDYLLKTSPVSWQFPDDRKGAAECPVWLSSIDRWFGGNAHVIDYFHKFCGYAMTGSVCEQEMTIFWGDGRNGKTTALNALYEIFGDYALKAPHSLLMSQSKESHPTALASLHGKRLVLVIETEEGARLNEVLVKELTGCDPITARRMREDFWTFPPSHKLGMATNHKPNVSGTDTGIWRRLHLVPFNITIPEADRDKQLPEKLRAEYPGILRWMAQGCTGWLKDGLPMPDEIKAATAEYRSSQDVLATFITECCSVGTVAYRTRKSDLYCAYEKWCEGNGERAVSGKRMGEYLTAKGYERVHSNGVWYIGIGLQQDF